LAPYLQHLGLVIRVAITGAGMMARHHLQALRRISVPHQVVAVCDPDPAAARDAAEPDGATVFADIGEMLEATHPDLVHVCTPAGRHVAAARAALEAGAHVYVEKPFVESEGEAAELLHLAESRKRLVCVGHQQTRDPAFQALLRRMPEVGAIVRIDSHFAFHPPGVLPGAGPGTLANRLLDIVPHPLSVLVLALERACGDPGAVELTNVLAEPADLHAVLRAGEIWGRLSVSLRARPVASMISVVGAGGTLTADFMRATVIGTANPGTTPVEKVLNPLIEGTQMVASAVRGVARRLITGEAYPGLVALLDEFYAAVSARTPAPFTPDHMRRVTAIYEELAAGMRAAVARVSVQRPARAAPAPGAPVAVLTGARGFFGRDIARELNARGFTVRGVGRSPDFDDPHVHEWRPADLSRPLAADILAGAAVVVHAVAASSGGFDSHQRHTIDSTRNLLDAMQQARVSRLVHISSLSVLRPPRNARERQDEQTECVPPNDRSLGPYTWGKAESERIIREEAATRGVTACVVRPAALVHTDHPELPGLLGRRLFGRWHLGLGRPGLPFAACDVRRAAALVAWCAEHFDDAPPIVNIIDNGIPSRGALLDTFRACGWEGRTMWMPIGVFAGLFAAARLAMGAVSRRRPERLRVWSIFRPRRYDATLSSRLLHPRARGADAPAASVGAPVGPVT
jgi:predicted dehydrogenase